MPLISQLSRWQQNKDVFHERYLRVMKNDKLSSYEELLKKDGVVSVCHKNIQSLAIEIFQIKQGILVKL